MLAGKDIYATTTPFWNLYFIYPPIAAILMTPLAFGPYTFWQVAWTAGLVAAQQSVLRRCGVPRGWKLGLLGVAVVLAVEPIRTTLGYGQVNTLLMALVVADLLPDAPGERRRIPQGTADRVGRGDQADPGPVRGLPLPDRPAPGRVDRHRQLPRLHWARRHPAVRRDHGSSSAACPGATREPPPRCTPATSPCWGCSSVSATPPPTTTLIGLGIAAIVALLGTLVAAHWWRLGQPVFAVAIAGMTTCLASPLSWTHHYVWILPLAVAVFRPGLPRWVRYLGGFWVVWVCVCLPLAVLPYGGARERQYDALQQLVANLGPIVGVVLVAGLAWQLVVTTRAVQPVGTSPPAQA